MGNLISIIPRVLPEQQPPILGVFDPKTGEYIPTTGQKRKLQEEDQRARELSNLKQAQQQLSRGKRRQEKRCRVSFETSSPERVPVQAPVQAPMQAPAQAPVQAPAQAPVQAPAQDLTDMAHFLASLTEHS